MKCGQLAVSTDAGKVGMGLCWSRVSHKQATAIPGRSRVGKSICFLLSYSLGLEAASLRLDEAP